MAQCKLIFFVSSCGSVWINNVSSQKSKTHERIKLFILACDMCAGYWLGIGDVPRSGRRLFCDNDWCNFLVPSLISIIGYYAQAAEVRRRFPVEGVGSLLFGLWLIIMPGFLPIC